MYQDAVLNRMPIEVKLRAGTYGYYNVAEQWNAMLGNPEIAEWGAALIVALLDRIDHMPNKDDTLSVFRSPEWAAIVAKRGPVEVAWQSTCSSCGHINIGFGVSGFLDEYYVIDYDAKTITWRSVYEQGAAIPKTDICAKCGNALTVKNPISPFLAVNGFTIIRT